MCGRGWGGCEGVTDHVSFCIGLIRGWVDFFLVDQAFSRFVSSVKSK